MRRRRILMSHQLVADWLKSKATADSWVIVSDVPDDLRVMGFEDDPMTGRVWVYVESETFDEVPELAVVPGWTPVFRKFR